METMQAERLALLLKALSHSTRLGILFILKETNGLDVASLQHEIEVSGPDLSRHLKVLEKAGILYHRKDGRRRIYWLENTELPDRLRHLLETPSL